MNVTVVIFFHKRQDVDKFKSVFAAAEKFRSEVGIKAAFYKNLGDPQGVVVIGTAPAKEAFVSFISSPAQQERMKNAGVTEAPSVTFIQSE